MRRSLQRGKEGRARPRAACIARLGVVLSLGVLPAPATAGDAAAPYPIACCIEGDRHGAITEPLLGAVQRQVDSVFRAILGSDHRLRFLDSSQAALLPAFGTADRAAMVEAWNAPERLLRVRVRVERNEYVVEAREFDPRFQVLGPVEQQRTMQREMVADAAGRAVLETFTPVALVRSVDGRSVHIEFVGGERLQRYRAWLGLSPDIGLQILREPVAAARSLDASDARPTRFRSSFLALRRWEGAAAECELVGQDQVFADLESARARYLARPVRGDDVRFRVQVIRKGDRQPQADCEVFVSPLQYSTEASRLRGLTDRSGLLETSVAGAAVQYVCVRFEDLVMKAPLLAGASADQMVFELPTRGRRAEFIRPLRQLVQEIDDQHLVDVRLREELKARVDAQDTAEVRRLVERGRSNRISIDDVHARLRDVEHRAELEGEDIREAAAQVRELAQNKLSNQLDQTLLAFSDWADKLDKKTAVEVLVKRINELQTQMEWDALVPLYEKLVAADPDNQKIAAELRLLKNDLQVKSPEHAAARTFVNEQLQAIATRDIASRWNEIDSAGRTLVEVKDHLTLLRLRRTMNQWIRDLTPEVKGLLDQIQAAGNDQDRLQELRDKQDQLNRLNESIRTLYKHMQDFLDTLKL